MQATTFPLTGSTTSTHGFDHSIVPQLQRSEIFRDYQQAFETTTGLPLALRPTGSFQSPLHASKRANSLCTLLAASNQSCAACLRLQQRMETEAMSQAKTFQCFAGLSESAAPVRVGESVIGHLQTGQVLLRPPTRAGFNKITRQLAEWGATVDLGQLESAYFRTRVVAKKQYDSMVRLLTIFAQHLATVSNQVLVQEATAELPAITKARAFISEHHGEDLSLVQVAKVVGMSAFYFCKTFRSVTGLTFTDFVARMRIESVKKMLLNPHTRISEAAYAAGFQSLSQFNRVFRRIAGESPSDYRDHLHGGSAPSDPPHRLLAHAA
jgi:AraC-like DNA-binding protein/ligand-binding sensor protein